MKNTLRFFIITFLSLQYFFASSQSGMALSLDGINDYMEVTDHDDIDINVGENFTITLWIKTSAISDFYRIVSKRVAGSGAGYEMITQSGVGAYGVNLRSTANTNSGPPFGTTSITDGSWHHLAMVVDVDNSSASIFVDGNMEQMSNVAAIGTESFANDVSFLLGTNISQSNFMNTLLDDVRLWQTALSGPDIISDMTLPVNGGEPNLIAVWDFENVSGNTVSSLTGVHDGTLHGGATTIDGNSPMTYLENALVSTTIPVGKGEVDQRVIAVNVVTQGNIDPIDLTEIQFNFSGSTDITDLSNAKVFYTGGNPKLNTDDLFGTATIQSGTITIAGNQTLEEGFNHFWITADLAANAQEGNILNGEIENVMVDGQSYAVANTSTDGRLIILEHKLLYSGGDYGSVNYRIPAIETGADGSLVIAADARVDQAGDLPNNVDIVIRRSTDMGDNWSESLTIADFGQSGASDPALVLDRNTGDLLCMFASHSGLFQSTSSNPIRFQVCRSQDNGQTWSTPEEFTDQIYNPSWSAAWLASGSAHQMQNGRIVGAVGVRETSGNAISNFMIYSDDGGQSWDYKPNVATTVGNEAKIVELDNGSLMMNIRNQTPDRRQIVVSGDGGDTWGTPYYQDELIDPYVNGDFIRYTSVLDGYNKSRLLFSIAAVPGSRRNLTVFLSYDEGLTWPVSKVINAGPSGYSSLAVLQDGTIGCFYENGEYENYQLYFARFSLEWLTDGTDAFLPVSTKNLTQGGLDFEISPNPSNGKTTVGFILNKQMRISATLYNVAGIAVAEILNAELSSGIHLQEIDLRNLTIGTYFLRVKAEGAAETKKLIVTK